MDQVGKELVEEVDGVTVFELFANSFDNVGIDWVGSVVLFNQSGKDLRYLFDFWLVILGDRFQ